jgi:DNA helicase II / ATP-dependent DNA helicase PcrA
VTQEYHKAAAEFRDNPGQLKVYNATGNCVVLAGPGSGKTKTLTVKMARILAEDVRPPRGVACITYSVECAAELQRRLDQLGVQEGARVFIGTVHSFCLTQILLPFGELAGIPVSGIKVVGEAAQAGSFASAVAEVFGPDYRPESLITRFNKYRRTFLEKSSAAFLQTDSEMASLVLGYEDLLREQRVIDFDGIVLTGLELVEHHTWIKAALRARFPILVVDEYQDLGLPLHRIVLSLCFDAGIRLLAVGDPDQSIYGFTGAKPELLVELSRMETVEKVVLRFNYRCGSTIVVLAETALGAVRNYQSKADDPGSIDFYECQEGLTQQADLICEAIIPGALERNPGLTLGKIAVLYLDRNDGEIIAQRATNTGLKFLRADRGAPYRRTPLVRWLEDCAKWSLLGWMTEPPLSALLRRWIWYHRSISSPKELLQKRAELVRFLFSRFAPTMPLGDWLMALEISTSFQSALEQEASFADELETLSQLKDATSSGGKLSKMTILEFSGHVRSDDHLNLLTLHSAKGLEFEVVIMIGIDQGRIPSYSATTDVAKKESRRLFYVALTRAKREIHLTYSGWYQNAYGRRFSYGPSEFLLELQRKYTDVHLP